MADNILGGGVEALNQAKTALNNRDLMRETFYKMKDTQTDLGKEIAAETKAMNSEIEDTIKARRSGIQSEYSKQLDDIKNQGSKVQKARDKEKGAKMGKRIEEETSGLRKDIKSHQKELKKYFKDHGVPGICRSKLYYIMFLPKGTAERMEMVLSFLLFFIGIPGGVATFCKWVMKSNGVADGKARLGCWVIFLVIFIIFLGIYFLLYVKTKIPYLEKLKEGREVRTSINKKEEKVREITRDIKKDKDESQYGLDEYDEKLSALKAQRDAKEEEMTKALELFDRETKEAIKQDISSKRQPKIDELTEKKTELDEKIKSTSQQIDSINSEIKTNYEAFLGESMCTVANIDRLIDLMKSSEGKVKTVSEALETYRKE